VSGATPETLSRSRAAVNERLDGGEGSRGRHPQRHSRRQGEGGREAAGHESRGTVENLKIALAFVQPSSKKEAVGDRRRRPSATVEEEPVAVLVEAGGEEARLAEAGVDTQERRSERGEGDGRTVAVRGAPGFPTLWRRRRQGAQGEVVVLLDPRPPLD